MKRRTIVANTANSITTSSLFETERREIEKVTEGLTARAFNFLHDEVLPRNKDNAMIICNYIQSMRQELNLSDGYREDIIMLLGNHSMFLRKSFKEATRENILSFLGSFRKPETSDPLHKWIGTYNTYRCLCTPICTSRRWSPYERHLARYYAYII